MKLKRNLLTVLYTILFLFIAGFGLFQMMNLIVSTVPNKYVVTTIIILGLIVYLLAAFFIKEAGSLCFIQKPGILMLLLECVVVLACGGLLFYLQWMDQGMAPAVIYTLLLLSMYVAARFCGGRLCGILCVIVMFYMLLSLAPTDLITTGSAIDILCFLIPYSVFTGFQRILIPFLGKNGFLIIASHLVLGFIFSLAIALNPFVCALLFGCIISLFFTTPRSEEQSVLAKGIFSALFLVIFTLGLLFCIQWMIPEILELTKWRLDRNLPLAFRFETLNYIMNKYTRPVIYLHLHSLYGVLPTLLFFFSFLAGYYTIRKKASYMGPLVFSQVALFIYYIAFCEGGSQFYSLYYLLPVFASYGFCNTLLSDEPVTKPVGGEAPESEEATEGDQEPVLDFEKTVLSETDEPPAPELESKPDNGAETVEMADALLENKTEPVENKSETEESRSESEEGTPEIVPQSETKAVISVPTAAPENDEIPEWTIPAEFLQKSPNEDDLVLQEMPALEEEPVWEEGAETDGLTSVDENRVQDVPEADDVLDLDQFVAEEAAITPDILPVPEPDPVDLHIHNDSDDIEPFVSAGTEAEEDSILSFSEEAEKEEDHLLNDTPEKPEEDETQLNDLLDRLDLSEPIKRMNESAQEDIADVIEREEEQVELSEALPLKPSKSALPKYKKPNFDFELEPVSIPLDDQYSTISEYDEVPTVHDLENQWKTDTKPVIETVATKVVELEEDEQTETEADSLASTQEEILHSEQIIRKNGMGKRSYHRITIR